MAEAPFALLSDSVPTAPSIDHKTTQSLPNPSIRYDEFESAVGNTIICAPLAFSVIDLTNNDPEEESSAPNTKLTKEPISFDEVFQDGKAPVKRIIIQFPDGHGPWYILRCNEHNLDFMHPPIRGASLHLKSEKHGYLRHLSKADIIGYLGIEVLKCSPGLAEKNNAITLGFFCDKKRPINRISDAGSGHHSLLAKPPQVSKTYSRTRVIQHDILKPKSKQRRLSGVPNPTSGRIYLAFRTTTKNWLPALLLPHISLSKFGIPGTLESLGLIDNLPACYEYNPETKGLKCKKDYERGGPNAMEREFPSLYFDGDRFPVGSPAGWVRAVDLQELNVFGASARLVSNLKIVRSYLRKRMAEEAEIESVSFVASSNVNPDFKTTDSSRVTEVDGSFLSVRDRSSLVAKELATEPISHQRQASSSLGRESQSFDPDAQPEQINRNCLVDPPESEPSSASDAKKPVGSDPCSQSASDGMDYRMTISNDASRKPDLSSSATLKGSPIVSAPIDLDQDREQEAAKPLPKDKQVSKFQGERSEGIPPYTQLQHHHQGQNGVHESELVGGQSIRAQVRLRMAEREVIVISDSDEDMSDEEKPILLEPQTAQLIQPTLFGYTSAELLKYHKKSIDLNFPNAVQGPEAVPPQLPPVRPRTVQWHRGEFVPPEYGFNTPCLKPTPALQNHSSLTRHTEPPTSSQSEIFHTSPAYKTHSQSHNGSNPAAVSSTLMQPLIGALSTHPYQSCNFRFGLPPHEVPLDFLIRLRRLAGSKDDYPPLSAFATEYDKNIYLCPWCQKKYSREVSFTDHLVLTHRRDPDPPIVSRVRSDSVADGRTGLTSE